MPAALPLPFAVCRAAGLAALVVACTLCTSPALAMSNATRYLIHEQTVAGCDGHPGSFGGSGVYEVDLDGDGHDDLVLSHQGLSCEGPMPSSLFCGAQVCSILVYYREGGLLRLRDEFLGRIVGFQPGNRPEFKIMNHGGATRTWLPR